LKSNPDKIITVSRSYGKRSSNDTSGNVTTDTVFQLASISKPFTASAVAKLLDLGIIPSIDQDICDVIPTTWNRSSCRNPHFHDIPVTWRHILTHRSSMIDDIPDVYIESEGQWVSAQYGPANFWNEDVFSYGNPTCPLTDVQSFYHTILTQDDDANTTVGGGDIDWYGAINSDNEGSWLQTSSPGGEYLYSNFAYGYLAALIELALAKNSTKQQSFEDFCQEYLFKVLGMNNTSWFLENIVDTSHAMGTLYDDDIKSFQDVGDNCYIDYASGQLYSSVNDISKFLHVMMKFGVPELWSETVGGMVLSCIAGNETCNGNDIDIDKEGFAWSILDNTMKGTFYPDNDAMDVYNWTNGGYHDGSVYGISTVMIVLPSSNMYIVVLTNTDSVEVDDLALIVMEASRKQKGSNDQTSDARTILRPRLCFVMTLCLSSLVVFFCWISIV
jgi:CubicO group peptidase (beta-lactamase class C family)